jgi:hypothetical protein
MVSPVVLEEDVVYKGFVLSLTACDLGLQIDDCNVTPMSLEDGIYIIKYSVSPNEYVYAEYNHLRITSAMIKLNEFYCDIEVSACEPSAKTKEKLLKANLIESYLKAAKAKVEYCHEPQKGIEIYRYAIKMINKLLCVNC